MKELSELERYLLTMIEPKLTKAEEIAKGFDIMEEYIDESERVITDISFGESYDKEWALKDEYLREGIKQGMAQGMKSEKIEIAKNMLNDGLSIASVSKYTNLSKAAIESFLE